jgi:L-iditol 2-dehydrogenase
MKTARYAGPEHLEVVEQPIPVIDAGEALVAVRACGLCGTDVKTFLRGHPLIPPGTVLGHEVAGIVEQSRHDAFAVGDRVVVAPYAPCGQCDPCRRSHPSLCERLYEAMLDPGGFAEFVRVPARLLDIATLHVPDGVALELASLCEPLACCVHGLEALGLDRVRSLLIVGDGPMGLMQAALARALGLGPVVLAGITPERLAFAEHVADVVIDVSRSDLAEAVRAALPSAPDAVVVSVADLTVLARAIDIVAKGGTVNVFAGMPRSSTLPLDLTRVHYHEVHVLGTFGFGPADFRRALDMIAAGTMPLQAMITDRIGIDQIEGAIRRAADHRGVKAVVVP